MNFRQTVKLSGVISNQIASNVGQGQFSLDTSPSNHATTVPYLTGDVPIERMSSNICQSIRISPISLVKTPQDLENVKGLFLKEKVCVSPVIFKDTSNDRWDNWVQDKFLLRGGVPGQVLLPKTLDNTPLIVDTTVRKGLGIPPSVAPETQHVPSPTGDASPSPVNIPDRQSNVYTFKPAPTIILETPSPSPVNIPDRQSNVYRRAPTPRAFTPLNESDPMVESPISRKSSISVRRMSDVSMRTATPINSRRVSPIQSPVKQTEKTVLGDTTKLKKKVIIGESEKSKKIREAYKLAEQTGNPDILHDILGRTVGTSPTASYTQSQAYKPPTAQATAPKVPTPVAHRTRARQQAPKDKPKPTINKMHPSVAQAHKETHTKLKESGYNPYTFTYDSLNMQQRKNDIKKKLYKKAEQQYDEQLRNL